jgi:uncharacterized membrane protein YesL
VASRAEAPTSPAQATRLPGLGNVVRAALSDYYFNSMRLVAANLVWGLALALILLVGLVSPLLSLALLPLLALPTAGVFRLAARIVRVEPGAGLRDITWPYRQAPARWLVVGVAVVAAALVLGTNLLVGLVGGEPARWAIATLAGWGLVVLWCGALVVWPLIVDPARSEMSLAEGLRLAGALLLTHPLRFAGLGLAMVVVTAVSIVLTAAILTISVAFVALVACRSVYPAADRLAPALGGERP